MSSISLNKQSEILGQNLSNNQIKSVSFSIDLDLDLADQNQSQSHNDNQSLSQSESHNDNQSLSQSEIRCSSLILVQSSQRVRGRTLPAPPLSKRTSTSTEHSFRYPVHTVPVPVPRRSHPKEEMTILSSATEGRKCKNEDKLTKRNDHLSIIRSLSPSSSSSSLPSSSSSFSSSSPPPSSSSSSSCLSLTSSTVNTYKSNSDSSSASAGHHSYQSPKGQSQGQRQVENRRQSQEREQGEEREKREELNYSQRRDKRLSHHALNPPVECVKTNKKAQPYLRPSPSPAPTMDHFHSSTQATHTQSRSQPHIGQIPQPLYRGSLKANKMLLAAQKKREENFVNATNKNENKKRSSL